MINHIRTTSQNPTYILRLEEVKKRTGLSRSSIYQRSAAGDFPKPISLGERAVGWIEEEVSNWLEDRISESRNH